MNSKTKPEIKKGKGIGNKKDLIFCILMVLVPTIQFLIFYIYTNINSVLLSFQEYDSITGQYSFSGINNFQKVFKELYNDIFVLKNGYYFYSLKNSFLVYVFGTIIGVTFSLLFSYAIFKKTFAHGFFRVVLFLPSIISPIVMVLIFKYFVDSFIPDIASKLFGKEMLGLLADGDTALFTLIFYAIWINFGVNVLMYTSAMSGINESQIEAGQIDGATNIQEFFHIILPNVYPTMVTFLIVGISGFFVNQMGLFSFYGEKAPIKLSTFGYYLYAKTYSAGLGNYPELSALGLIFSLITIPITFLFRYILNKVGPSVE